MERFILYSPNGKHGVNTLECKARYDSDGNPIYPDGWRALTDEQVEGLYNKILAWDNGELVAYTETEEELQAKQKEIERQALLEELKNLNKWFVEIYDNQIKQAERCKRLNIDYDQKYGTVEELDTLAVQNAARIQEIREELK